MWSMNVVFVIIITSCASAENPTDLINNQTDDLPKQTKIVETHQTEVKLRKKSEEEPKETMDQSKPLIEMKRDEVNQSEIIVIEASGAKLLTELALNNSGDETQNIRTSNERESLNIATPSSKEVPHPKIVGGTRTDIKLYPYTVQIYLGRAFSCGGSIITRHHIVTAAHCVKDSRGNIYNPKNLKIRAGSSFLFSEGSLHYLSAIVSHEKHIYTAKDHDIAVLVLKSPVVYSEKVQKATLPPQDYELPKGITLIVVGWGFTHPYKPVPSTFLNHVAVQLVDQQKCALEYASVLGEITDNMICAGFYGLGGKDACSGDSGGPLIKGKVLVGVVSWGRGCGEQWYPGVYTKVSSYTNWLNLVMDKTAYLYTNTNTTAVTTKGGNADEDFKITLSSLADKNIPSIGQFEMVAISGVFVTLKIGRQLSDTML